MKLNEAMKYFKEYNVTFKKNDLNLYEVKGSITIPSIWMNDDVFMSKLKTGDMLGEETLVTFAEILDAKIAEARKL